MVATPRESGPPKESLCLGEWTRSLDERYRLSLPTEMVELLVGDESECVLAKERPGCVSLWNPTQWKASMADGVDLVASKIQSGRLSGRLSQVQMLGRLLSTRHRTVLIAGRGRIAIPESFRDFLEVEPGGDLMIVGAAICIEIWHPRRWSEHIGEHMPEFRELFDQLAS
ncbi:MAG: division/cell wall cluster transcriptional repressor MraZ [Planctomycetes bacterium]|nr:division/cell wall cluster transcriptional repressor MraZ [Planctomycetota bacterium]